MMDEVVLAGAGNVLNTGLVLVLIAGALLAGMAIGIARERQARREGLRELYSAALTEAARERMRADRAEKELKQAQRRKSSKEEDELNRKYTRAERTRERAQTEEAEERHG